MRPPRIFSEHTREMIKKMYLDDEKNLVEISKKLNIPTMTLYNKMLLWNIPIRGKRNQTLHSRINKSIMYTKYPKSDFSEDTKEKAYLIGFALGDLSARKNSMNIRVSCSSNHPAQIKIFENLFDKYSTPNKYPSKNRGTKYFFARYIWSLWVNVNKSFSFLLDKNHMIEMASNFKEDEFKYFLAGFFDAEGCVILHKVRKNTLQYAFNITNKNYHILKKIFLFLIKNRIKASLFYSKPKDIYVFYVGSKKSFYKLANMLLPIIKHQEKIDKIRLLLEEKNEDKLEISWKCLRESIHKEVRASFNSAKSAYLAKKIM